MTTSPESAPQQITVQISAAGSVYEFQTDPYVGAALRSLLTNSDNYEVVTPLRIFGESIDKGPVMLAIHDETQIADHLIADRSLPLVFGIYDGGEGPDKIDTRAKAFQSDIQQAGGYVNLTRYQL